MDDYLSKPFTQKQLQRALNRWATQPATGPSDFPSDALDMTITSQLLDLDEEEPGFISDVIDSFFRNADEGVARMKTAIENGDLDVIHSTAHMMRGSSQQLGARRLGATCREVENATTMEDAKSIVGRVETELEGARRALTNIAERALDAAS
jgi:HPt (histidine-containing phosphotransfer) domain-containing protein